MEQAIIAGVITGVFVVAVGLYLEYKTGWFRRKEKRLQATIVSNTPVITVQSTFREKVRCSYEDKQIEDLSLIRLVFDNIGNVPIESGDFERPIQICIGEKGEIIEKKIFTEPPNIGADMTLARPYQAEIPKCLLNSGDKIMVQLVCVNNTEGTLDIVARIVGVKEIEIRKVEEGGKVVSLAEYVRQAELVTLLVLVLVALVASYFQSQIPSLLLLFVYGVLLGYLIIVLLFWLLTSDMFSLVLSLVTGKRIRIRSR